MTEQTLHFSSPRDLQTLLANDLKNLALIENAFHVKLTSREGWLKIAGEAVGIDKTKQLFDNLQSARQRGVTLRRQEFHYALTAVIGEEADKLDNLYSSQIEVSSRRRSIAPKTFGQQAYVDAIRHHDIVFGIGPAGTGKTYLAVAMAVHVFKQERVSRIILARPAVEAGESLGFLPGDLNEKVFPYLRPLYDALYDMMEPEEVARLSERGTIEIAPLAYMRGRTLNNSFVILDEAQNATSEQMLMFLTRLGFDSKCVVTGDITQVDLPHNKRSGLIEVQNVLKEIKGISFTYFSEKDVVRHELVQQIIKAYEAHKGNNGRPQQPPKNPAA
ncbi:MAG: PhoH family protein [Verrucomicrobiae bacterium]|nr:PhoH family protein [Verrucomicrobiae bacterium]